MEVWIKTISRKGKFPVLWAKTDVSKWSNFTKGCNNRWWNLDASFVALIKSAISLWKHTDSPPQKKTRQIKYDGDVMMIIFFVHKGVIYQQTVPSKTAEWSIFYVSLGNFATTRIKKASWTDRELNTRTRRCPPACRYFFSAIS